MAFSYVPPPYKPNLVLYFNVPASYCWHNYSIVKSDIVIRAEGKTAAAMSLLCEVADCAVTTRLNVRAAYATMSEYVAAKFAIKSLQKMEQIQEHATKYEAQFFQTIGQITEQNVHLVISELLNNAQIGSLIRHINVCYIVIHLPYIETNGEIRLSPELANRFSDFAAYIEFKVRHTFYSMGKGPVSFALLLI